MIRSGAESFLWQNGAMHRPRGNKLAILRPVSPLWFVGPDSALSNLGGDAIPGGPPTATEVAGRRGWSMTMISVVRDDSVEFVVDDATGLLLRGRGLDGKFFAEMTDVATYAELPEDFFGWEGDVAPPTAAERRRDPEHLRRVAEMATAVTPKYWPTGVDSTPLAGDPETGELVVSLAVGGYPTLARWPRDAQPTLIDPQLTGRYPHSVEWTDDRWTWRLMTVEVLDADSVRRIRESM